jgi:hypothetical protein
LCRRGKTKKNQASFFLKKKAKKKEYNRSSTIEDLPLLSFRVRRNSVGCSIAQKDAA